MISMFSSPAAFKPSATNCAPRCTSAACSGSVLMVGIRRKFFSSSRKRDWLLWTNASVAEDMALVLGRVSAQQRAGGKCLQLPCEKNHYTAAVLDLSDKREQA